VEVGSYPFTSTRPISSLSPLVTQEQPQCSHQIAPDLPPPRSPAPWDRSPLESPPWPPVFLRFSHYFVLVFRLKFWENMMNLGLGSLVLEEIGVVSRLW